MKLKTLSNTFFTLLLIIITFSCSKGLKQEPISITSKDLHNSIDKIVEIMIHDIFSPPVASRIFAYPNIAAYEIIAQVNPEYKSLAGSTYCTYGH